MCDDSLSGHLSLVDCEVLHAEIVSKCYPAKWALNWIGKNLVPKPPMISEIVPLLLWEDQHNTTSVWDTFPLAISVSDAHLNTSSLFAQVLKSSLTVDCNMSSQLQPLAWVLGMNTVMMDSIGWQSCGDSLVPAVCNVPTLAAFFSSWVMCLGFICRANSISTQDLCIFMCHWTYINLMRSGFGLGYSKGLSSIEQAY